MCPWTVLESHYICMTLIAAKSKSDDILSLHVCSTQSSSGLGSWGSLGLGRSCSVEDQGRRTCSMSAPPELGHCRPGGRWRLTLRQGGCTTRMTTRMRLSGSRRRCQVESSRYGKVERERVLTFSQLVCRRKRCRWARRCNQNTSFAVCKYRRCV